MSKYCVQSEENCQKHESETQQNAEIQENSIILALRKDLEKLQQEVSNKNEALDALYAKLEDQGKRNEECAEKLEQQSLQACQREIELEGEIIHLQKLVAKEHAETSKVLKERIDEKYAVMTDRESRSRKIIDQMDKLSKVYQKTNERLADDASTILKQENIIKEQQNQKIIEYTDFITFVREREGKLVAHLRLLEKSVGSKHHQGQREAKDTVRSISKLLVKEDFQNAISAVRKLK